MSLKIDVLNIHTCIRNGRTKSTWAPLTEIEANFRL